MRFRSFLLTVSLALLLIGLGSATLNISPASAAAPQPQVIPFHPVNPNYSAIKANLDARAPRGGAAWAVSSAPTPFVNWEGQGPSGGSPSDANGAIGPDRYIETVNTTTGVYDRSGNLLSQSSLPSWTGFSCAGSDPVVMYSVGDQRYYATAVCITLLQRYSLIFGWSKTSQPSASGSDWCFYNSSFNGRYGANLPDYPKLGDTSQLVLIGVNTFSGNTYLGSDVNWVQKPPKGNLADCSFSPKLGTFQNLKNQDGTQAATPNPMKEADASATGAVIANEDPGSGSSTILTAYQVSVVNGKPKISAPKAITVPSYSYPPSAPQKGTNKTLDTLDARMMSGWLANDPGHGNALCAWTGHTVKASTGGLGAEYRWYEICAPGTLAQSGVVQRTDRYVFMGAISPDRNAATKQFGDKWLATVNTSSSNMYVTVSAASATGLTDVYQSTSPDTDFTCSFPFGPPCRWGDYSGASPDPAATTQGQVWGSGMFSVDRGLLNPGWGTWNFGAVP